MDADERDICNYLKSWPGQFVYGRDIARRAAGKWRFREDPGWATPVLTRLVEQGLVESDSTGQYRLRIKKEKPKKWVSPEIKEILDKSSKDFSQVFEIDDPEDEEHKSE
jgi:hypothetical protein